MNKKVELALGIGLTISTITALGYDVNKKTKEAKQKEIAKEYVKKNAPDKYMNLLEKESKGQTIRWNKAVENVRDSLRIDSMCQKAYFDGAQMVRDSIKNANLSPKQLIKNIK